MAEKSMAAEQRVSPNVQESVKPCQSCGIVDSWHILGGPICIETCEAQRGRIAELESKIAVLESPNPKTNELLFALSFREQIRTQLIQQALVDREGRVAEWVKTRIGEAHTHRRERAMRATEEVIELAQAEGITKEQVVAQAEHVYARPAGEPSQEAAGVAVCLLGWCAATGNTLNELADREIARIEAKPIDQIRGSVARKGDSDLVLAVNEREVGG